MTTDWTQALCAEVGVEPFFPEKGGSLREPRAICGRCDIRNDCLEWVLRIEAEEGAMPGFYGGHAPKEREAIRRERKAA